MQDDLSRVSISQLIAAQGWQAQYRLITQWGTCISFKPTLRHSLNLIKGCETAAWLAHEKKDDKHYFFFDSESRVMNGLVAVLLSVMNAKTSAELAQLDVKQLLSSVGLEKHLTPSRNNGLNTIIDKAFQLAVITN